MQAMDADIDDLLNGLDDAVFETPIQTNDESNELITASAKSLPPSNPSNSTFSAQFPERELVALDTEISALFIKIQSLFKPRLEKLSDGQLTAEKYWQLINLVGNEEVNPLLLEPDVAALLGREQALVLMIYWSTTAVPQLPVDTYDLVLSTGARLNDALQRKQRLISEVELVFQQLKNTRAFLSPSVGAKLLIKVGGVNALALTPSANLVNPQTSVLAEEKMIRGIPHDKKRQALRLLAAKVVLAARIDAASSSPTESPCISHWKQDLDRRLEKLLMPPLALQQRSLPKPVDKRTSRRGGQKLRRRRQKQQQKIGEPEVMRFG